MADSCELAPAPSSWPLRVEAVSPAVGVSPGVVTSWTALSEPHAARVSESAPMAATVTIRLCRLSFTVFRPVGPGRRGRDQPRVTVGTAPEPDQAGGLTPVSYTHLTLPTKRIV